MIMSPARFNATLQQMGQQVAWRVSSLCPCRDPLSGAALQGCGQCAGRGVFWAPSVPAWTGVASLKITRQYADFGRWETGDVVLTVPSASPLWAACKNDLIVMTQSSEPFQTILTQNGAPQIEVVRGPVVSVSQCFWLTANTSATIQGSIPAIDQFGNLTWAAGAVVPPEGVQFSIQGRRNPTFFVWVDLPQDRSHFGGLPLPRRIAARAFDLFGR